MYNKVIAGLFDGKDKSQLREFMYASIAGNQQAFKKINDLHIGLIDINKFPTNLSRKISVIFNKINFDLSLNVVGKQIILSLVSNKGNIFSSANLLDVPDDVIEELFEEDFPDEYSSIKTLNYVFRESDDIKKELTRLFELAVQ